MQEIRVEKTLTMKRKPTDETKLGFGQIFTDHMLVIDYRDGAWGDARVVPYGDFQLDPACMVFHYGQAIFEGTKCYFGVDGKYRLFRPMDNFQRMNRSAERMCIPTIDPDLCIAGLRELLKLDLGWTPKAPDTSLYIRPAMMATDAHLGVRASHTYRFFVILSPVGAYYKDGLKPVPIYVEDEYVRAVRGGVGHAKAAGNYAASILAGEVAKQKGYAQVLWLDGVEQKYVEEVGSMNMMFVYGDRVVTPKLNGSILPGITRDSVLKLAREMGLPVSEERVAIADVISDIRSGKLTEAFGTGTAAVISPVRSLCFKGEDVRIGDGGIGRVSQRMYDTLTGIQYGRVKDPFGWTTILAE